MSDWANKPKVSGGSAVRSQPRPLPPVPRPAPRLPDTSLPDKSLQLSVRRITDLVLHGDVKDVTTAANMLKRQPPARRETLLGVLTWNKAVMDKLAPVQKTAGVQSPALDLCLLGGLQTNPLTYDPATTALVNASRFVNLSLGEKLWRAIETAPIGESLKKQLLSILSVESLVASAAVFTALQLIPAGWALDGAVLLIAVAVYGPAAVSIGEHLGQFFRVASSAASEDDLKIAGNHFAEAVSILGTVALGAVIGRAASPVLTRKVGVVVPKWKTQYDAGIKQGLTDAQAGVAAGAKVQAPVKAPVQPVAELPGVYAGSAQANTELLALTGKLAARFKVESQARDGLKGLPRAQEKVAALPAGKTASSLLDVSAARLVFNTLDEVYVALTYIRGKYPVVQIKDRFVSPQPSGYRDILLNLRMRNGYVVELRLEVKAMSEYAAQEHLVYEQIRVIRDRASAQRRITTQAEDQRIAELEAGPKQVYGEIWKTLTGRQK